MLLNQRVRFDMTYIKSFKRYLKENQDRYYTMELSSAMTVDDVQVSMGKLLPLVMRMLKTDSVHITIEPIVDGEEDE